MGVRTFSREDVQAANAAWVEGGFDPRWQAFRELASGRGILYPPSGTKWDRWEDDAPSQRAILWRAIDETPELLRRCILRSRSWQEVVAHLTGERDAWRRRLDADAHADEQRERGERVGPEEAKAILRRLQS